MDDQDLKALLTSHPPPWRIVATGGWIRAVDASGDVVEFAERLLPGLVNAVNVASDYLEIVADLLEECADVPESPTGDQTPDGRSSVQRLDSAHLDNAHAGSC